MLISLLYHADFYTLLEYNADICRYQNTLSVPMIKNENPTHPLCWEWYGRNRKLDASALIGHDVEAVFLGRFAVRMPLLPFEVANARSRALLVRSDIDLAIVASISLTSSVEISCAGESVEVMTSIISLSIFLFFDFRCFSGGEESLGVGDEVVAGSCSVTCSTFRFFLGGELGFVGLEVVSDLAFTFLPLFLDPGADVVNASADVASRCESEGPVPATTRAEPAFFFFSTSFARLAFLFSRRSFKEAARAFC
jgi:hypothetical protein